MRYFSHLLESKRPELKRAGEDVEKREPLCPVGLNVNWYDFPQNSTFRYVSKENENGIQNICTLMFIEAYSQWPTYGNNLSAHQ